MGAKNKRIGRPPPHITLSPSERQTLKRFARRHKTAQALARHSKIDMTMNVYTHTVIGDLAAAVESLPALPLPDAEAVPQPEALAATGTDGAVEGDAKRRMKRRAKSDSKGRNLATGGNVWQDRTTGGGDGRTRRKSLKLVDKDNACQGVTNAVQSEADGIRTRNHRIDSPVVAS